MGIIQQATPVRPRIRVEAQRDSHPAWLISSESAEYLHRTAHPIDVRRNLQTGADAFAEPTNVNVIA
jgi:hypothetical protein